MLPLLLALSLAQTQPAIRRSTPLSDDPGMVVRQAGTVNVNVTGGSAVGVQSDGGLIGTVWAVGPDGGPVSVVCLSGCSGSGGSGWVPDGGLIGFLKMPDGGPQEVYVVNPSTGGGGWVPDGGLVGIVTQGAGQDGGAWAVDTELPDTLGQKTMAGSTSVVIASDQSAVPVSGTVAATQSGTWNINNVSGTVSLPTGAATSALQTTGNTSLSSIDTKTPALGQTTMAGSTPVAIASNQTAIPVTDNGGSLTVDGTVAVSSVGGTVTVSGTVDTELPAAASLADATANPSTTSVGALNLLYNGTTWDRMRGDTTNGLLVNVSDSFLLDATFTARFLAAAAAADNTANPTTTGVLGFGMLWDGSTWDRAPGNSADGMLVNLGANNDVTVTSISAGTNYIGKTRLTDGTLDLSLLNSAPGSDTGQVSVPVRIISSLAGGAGGTSSSYGAAFPATGTAAGFSDGTNMQGAKVYDYDTGAGSDYVMGSALRVPASGGSVNPFQSVASAAPVAGGLLGVQPARANASAPSWSEGFMVPLSTDLAGALRITGTVTANAGTGNFATNLAQYGGVAVGAANALHVQPGTGAQFTVLGTKSQNAATPGATNVGALVAVATTSDPSYSDTNMVTLSSDTAGFLRTRQGILVGANMRTAEGYDADTGAGSNYLPGVLLRFSASGGSVEAAAGAGATTSGTQRVVLPTDQSAIPVTQSGSWSLAANQSVNVAQMNGVAVSMGNGVSGTGVQRVTLASDSTGQVTLATGSNTIGALVANQSVNLSQVAGTTTATGNGVAGAGVQRVTIASDNTAFTVNAAQSGTWTVQPGNTANTTAWLVNAGQVASANNDGSCVSVSTTTTVLASNASRRQAAIVARMSNTDTVFIKFGATATTADFPLEPGQVYNLEGASRVYTGVIDAIANSGTQSVCVTEFN